jgi:hypothetical protein
VTTLDLLPQQTTMASPALMRGIGPQGVDRHLSGVLAAALTRRYRVGRSYRATFSCSKPVRGSPLTLVCEWEPNVPSRLTGAELRAYRRARDAFAAEVASIVGGVPAVVEV